MRQRGKEAKGLRTVKRRVGRALIVAVTVATAVTACHHETPAPSRKSVEAVTGTVGTTKSPSPEKLPLARRPYPATRQLPLAPTTVAPATRVTGATRKRGV